MPGCEPGPPHSALPVGLCPRARLGPQVHVGPVELRRGRRMRMAAVEAKKKAATQRVSGRWAEAAQAVTTRVAGARLGHAPLGCQASCSDRQPRQQRHR